MARLPTSDLPGSLWWGPPHLPCVKSCLAAVEPPSDLHAACAAHLGWRSGADCVATTLSHGKYTSVAGSTSAVGRQASRERPGLHHLSAAP